MSQPTMSYHVLNYCSIGLQLLDRLSKLCDILKTFQNVLTTRSQAPLAQSIKLTCYLAILAIYLFLRPIDQRKPKFSAEIFLSAEIRFPFKGNRNKFLPFRFRSSRNRKPFTNFGCQPKFRPKFSFY